MPITGGGSSVGTLDDLTDVLITSATTNDVLQYNGTNWINRNQLIIGDNTGGASPTTGRVLDLRQLCRNNTTQVNIAYAASGFTGPPSGTWRGLLLALTGTAGWTAGTALDVTGMFFTTTFTLPSGVGVTTARGAVFQNSSQETSGSTNGIVNNYGLIGSAFGTSNTTAHVGAIICGVAGQVILRNKSVDLLVGVRAERAAGTDGVGVATDAVAFDVDSGFGSGFNTNFSAFRVPAGLVGGTTAVLKRCLNILATFDNVLAGKTTIGAAASPLHGLDVQQSLGLKITANKVAAYNAAEEVVIPCDASGGAFAVNLPTAVGRMGRVYIIKKVDATGNAVTVTPNGAETIDGAATVVLNAQWQVTRIISNNANWLII